MKRALITGGAGFIGSHLADRLLSDGVEVVVVDDFRTGRRSFLEHHFDDPGFRLVEGDVLDPAALDDAIKGCDWVFHLQANADVRHGLEHRNRDLEQNTTATWQVLEAMQRHRVSRVLLSSTGSVYGEPKLVPTPEDAPFPVQTSLYGASKIAAEGLVSAYIAGSDTTGITTGVICRFVSILGERYTHGHVVDFFEALRKNPDVLDVLGDGHQEKSYLYVADCVNGMVTAARYHENNPGAFVYNLGTDETIQVDDSIKVITNCLGVSPEIRHAGGERGWPGDSPLILLETWRLRALGWLPSLTIAEAITRTVDWLVETEGFSKNTEVTR